MTGSCEKDLFDLMKKCLLASMFLVCINVFSYQDDDYDFLETTISDLHAAFESGDLTCEEVAQFYVARILNLDVEAVNGPNPINSVLHIDPKVFKKARKLDKKFRHKGLTGALHCVPVLLKDNYNTKDMPTTASSLVLHDSIPEEDAFAVKKMRKAGALIIGKANMDEFAASVSGSNAFSQIASPYDSTRAAGGSSSGSGVAVSANFAVVGTGTDTCQSVRLPASYNSLVSIRPSVGLVSQSGLVPLSNFTDTGGPMARTVNDVAILLGVMAAEDPSDPKTSDAELQRPENYTQFLREDGLEGKRVGVLRTYRGADANGDPISINAFGSHGETNALIDQAVLDMESRGATIVENVDLYATTDITQLMFFLLLADLPNVFNTYVASVGLNTTFDEVIMSGQLGSAAQGLFDLSTISPFSDPFDPQDFYDRIADERAHIESVMNALDLDVLIYPSAPNGPSPLIEDLANVNTDTNCHLSATTGMPAMVVPAGFTTDGRAVGMEIMARKFDEPTLIEVGYAYEQATHHRQAPILTPTVVPGPPLEIDQFNNRFYE